jgi:hypothetical protein
MSVMQYDTAVGSIPACNIFSTNVARCWQRTRNYAAHRSMNGTEMRTAIRRAIDKQKMQSRQVEVALWLPGIWNRTGK